MLITLKDDRQRRNSANIEDSLCAWNMGVKDIIKPQGGLTFSGEADLESEIPGGFRNAFTERGTGGRAELSLKKAALNWV